jgi:predicted nucleic acid-binding protein
MLAVHFAHEICAILAKEWRRRRNQAELVRRTRYLWIADVIIHQQHLYDLTVLTKNRRFQRLVTYPDSLGIAADESFGKRETS